MEQYLQINQMYWNGSPFQWAFYVSILLILIFEKRKTLKLVFGVFPIVMLVGMFNPLTSFVIGSILRYSNLYYVRLFSAIPVFYCMAHGVMLLLNRMRGAGKLVGVCAATALIIYAGNCVYREPWMQRAANLQKTPDAVFEVLDVLPRENGNACVAFPDPLYLYARQVDADIIMPYGRSLSGVPIPLLQQLNQPVPDVAAVMTMAGNDGVDYVVINRNDDAKAVFLNSGYEPVGETSGYCIYAVTGTPKTVKTLNEKRQVVSTVSLDADGNPAYSTVNVIAAREYTYDRWGNQIEEKYYGKDGQRVTTIDGFSGKKKSYVLHGLAWLADSVVNLDPEDRSLLVSGRYETKYRYLHRRDLIEESYYDADGQPMNRLDTGYASTTKQYDDQGRIISERFSDTAGSPTICFDGYAGYDREYDGIRRIASEKYVDAQGVPINNQAGFATWNRAYDEYGNLTEEAFLDADGNIVDIRGRILEETAVDLLQKIRKENVANSVGVGFQWNEDGSCTVAGEAQGITWNDIIMADRPYYFLNGASYRVEYSAENVSLRIYFYEDSTWNNRIGNLSTYGDTEFTVPQNCGAMIIRLWVAPGASVNETVYPRIYVKNDAA